MHVDVIIQIVINCLNCLFYIPLLGASNIQVWGSLITLFLELIFYSILLDLKSNFIIRRGKMGTNLHISQFYLLEHDM